MNGAPVLKVGPMLWAFNKAVLIPGGSPELLNVPEGLLYLFLSGRWPHDLNKSGWGMAAEIVPVVNVFFILYQFLIKDTTGSHGLLA